MNWTNILYKFSLLKLVLNKHISFKYWIKYKPEHDIWVYNSRIIENSTENVYFEPKHIKLINKDKFRTVDNLEFSQNTSSGIYLLEDNVLQACEISENKTLELLKPLSPLILKLQNSEITQLQKLAQKNNQTIKELILNTVYKLQDVTST